MEAETDAAGVRRLLRAPPPPRYSLALSLETTPSSSLAIGLHRALHALQASQRRLLALLASAARLPTICLPRACVLQSWKGTGRQRPARLGKSGLSGTSSSGKLPFYRTVLAWPQPPCKNVEHLCAAQKLPTAASRLHLKLLCILPTG